MTRATRYAWALVVGAALGISWWSLKTMGEGFGMPSVLAAVVSAVFDGGALIVGELSMRYARSADSGAAPRALMVALVAASAWLNWSHAELLGYGLPARVMFGAPSIVAGVLVEIELRWHHRESLRERGRVAPALPSFGRWCWLLHPCATGYRVWQITANRVYSVPLTAMDMTPTRRTVLDPVGVEPTGTEIVRVESASALDASTPGAPEAHPAGTPAGSPTGTRMLRRPPARRPPRVAPDTAWLPFARSVVDQLGEVPSARELAGRLRIGQDRARRLLPMLAAEQLGDPVNHVNGRPLATS